MARTNKSRVPALGYYRTSSAANVGNDKDSEKRQRQARPRSRTQGPLADIPIRDDAI